MHISKLSLIALLAFSHNAIQADATDDLFAAIEARNVTLVSQALTAGADTNLQRSSDGLTAKTLACEQLKALFQNPTPIAIAGIATLALPIASFMHNKGYAALSLAGIAAGAGLSIYRQNTPEEDYNFVQKVTNTVYLDSAISYASIAGLLATAWASKQWALSGIGTAALATIYYFTYKFSVASEIYAMVDPTGETLSLSCQLN